jgi:hypothetical protein
MRDELATLWEASVHEPCGELDADLDRLRRFYDPVVAGRKLRERVLEVAVIRSTEFAIPRQARVLVGPERMIITLEGRVLLELLDQALAATSASIVVLDDDRATALLAAVLDRYREWGRRRLEDVVRLMSGGKALQVPAIGGAITLLVNRSDRPDRAIQRVPDGSARDEIDAAFRTPAEAFSRVIAPSERRSAEKERLVSGWTLHEINRRLPGALVIEDERLYVEPERRTELVAFLGRELARPRRRVTTERLELAIDELVGAYRRNIDILAGFGMAFERPSDTNQLKVDLVTEFNKAAK